MSTAKLSDLTAYLLCKTADEILRRSWVRFLLLSSSRTFFIYQVWHPYLILKRLATFGATAVGTRSSISSEVGVFQPIFVYKTIIGSGAYPRCQHQRPDPRPMPPQIWCIVPNLGTECVSQGPLARLGYSSAYMKLSPLESCGSFLSAHRVLDELLKLMPDDLPPMDTLTHLWPLEIPAQLCIYAGGKR